MQLSQHAALSNIMQLPFKLPVHCTSVCEDNLSEAREEYEKILIELNTRLLATMIPLFFYLSHMLQGIFPLAVNSSFLLLSSTPTPKILSQIEGKEN